MTIEEFLSNTWLVAAVALIPGFILGLIVCKLLGGRPDNNDDNDNDDEE